MKIIIRLCLYSLLFCSSLPFFGSGTDQILIPLSNPDKPGTISINHYKGSIHVTGYSGKTVMITANYRNPTNSNGMKLISSSAVTLSATEKNNVVVVKVNSYRRTIDLDIRVPYEFSLIISNDDNGDILVRDVSGVFELNNNNGDVKLFNVSGSAIISTIDGNILTDFINVDPEMPMALSTIEGQIDMNLPGNANISLKMRTEYGEIYSDFNINIDKRKINIRKHKNTRSTNITLDGWTYGKINNGGPEYLIKTLNGNIYIKKKK
ncbi:MAG: DUF4097 family beta strand repeat protein [Candidatus Aminicenantes bacterium]|nr:DUF4097 family beta strand repeat protein [Candidatus Aminicenantes bacterium]